MIFETVDMCVYLESLFFRSSGQVCLLGKGHEAFQRMERLGHFFTSPLYLCNNVHSTGKGIYILPFSLII